VIAAAPALRKRLINFLTVSGLSPRSAAMAAAWWPRPARSKMTCRWGTEMARPIRGLLTADEVSGLIPPPIRTSRAGRENPPSRFSRNSLVSGDSPRHPRRGPRVVSFTDLGYDPS
jgi:hypothetical protein